jgi:hypothetical protein
MDNRGPMASSRAVREVQADEATGRADSVAEVLAEAGLEVAAALVDLAAVAAAVPAARSGREMGNVEMALILETARIGEGRGLTVKPPSA